MNMHEKFRMERIEGIAEQGKDEEARRLSQAWISHPGLHQYSYNFS